MRVHIGTTQSSSRSARLAKDDELADFLRRARFPLRPRAGANQIVQHDGRQVLRIAPSVRKDFDGSTVEAVDGALGDVSPGSLPTDDGS